jgi:hypothetical protein
MIARPGDALASRAENAAIASPPIEVAALAREGLELRREGMGRFLEKAPWARAQNLERRAMAQQRQSISSFFGCCDDVHHEKQ